MKPHAQLHSAGRYDQ